MRIVIEVEQAPEFSFMHFNEMEIEDFVEGLCPDPNAKFTVKIERGENETNEGIKWA